jgi:hypothetical protein
MGWGSDDDEDENEFIDLGAVEDRGRRGRQAREDDDEEEEEEAEEDHVERKAATEDDDIEEQRPLPHPRSSRSPHPSSTSTSPPPPPRPDDAASADAAAQKTAVQNNTQIALLYLTHKVAEEVGRERGVKFSKQVRPCRLIALPLFPLDDNDGLPPSLAHPHCCDVMSCRVRC